MKHLAGRAVMVALLLAAFPFVFERVAGGADQAGGLAGWEKGGVYDRHYNLSDFDQFKGVVEDIADIVPLPGMAPGVGLVVLDEGKEQVRVQLGPKAFVDLKTIGLKKGDKVKIKGAWAEINGEDVFMAAKVKKGEFIEVKFRRTKDGTPLWTLSPEEQASEQSQD